jgi:hypothetical protein
MALTTEERFWSHVDRSNPNDCWPWTSETNNKGYGRFATYAGGRRRRVLAHRFAYQDATGQAPSAGTVLLHSCDNPPCVNPAHLRPGTQAENMADARRKGRTKKPPLHVGVKAHSAKLCDDDVRDIRMWLSLGYPQHSIATAYHVTQNAISQINLRKTWQHVSDTAPHGAPA